MGFLQIHKKDKAGKAPRVLSPPQSCFWTLFLLKCAAFRFTGNARMAAAAATHADTVGFAHTTRVVFAVFSAAGDRHAVIRHMVEFGNAVAGHALGFFKGRAAGLAARAGAGAVT